MQEVISEPINVIQQNEVVVEPKKSRKVIYLLLLLMFFIISTSLGIILGYNYSTSQTLSPDESVTIVDALSPTPTLIEHPRSFENEYVSQKLGIKFTYSSITDLTYKWPVKVAEDGNRIQLLYQPNNGEWSNGQHVDVITKDPSDDLVTAIQKTILTGYNLEDCEINLTSGDPMNSSALFATITVPGYLDNDMEETFELAKKCPADYTKTNYVNFFYYNPLHNDKFLYFNLGQDGSTLLGNEKEWYQTVEFIK